MGAYTAAFVAAFAGTYFVAAPIAGEYGWRIAVIATSAPAFIGFILSVFFIEEMPIQKKEKVF